MSRRKLAIVGSLVLALVVGLTTVAFVARPAAEVTAAVPTLPPPTLSPTPTPSPTPRPTPSPTPVPSPTPIPDQMPADLTGLTVDRELAHRLPIAVLIDDNRIARPQSGFNGASIVYQAPADGGETRYLFIYQEGESADIGPVRSGRIYFAEWAAEMRAGIGHYGGDRKTRRYIANSHGKTLWSIDGMGRGNSAYHRISSRRAPHNAYTSTEDLRRVAEERLKAPKTIAEGIHLRPFVDPSAPDERPAKQSIRVPYRTGIVSYGYDPKTNAYVRSIDNRPQIDPADGKRVTTTNVVVLFMKFWINTKIEPGHARPVVESIGTGKALVFQEGRLIAATWKKANALAPTLIVDASGKEIPLVRGRTFIQVVPLGTKVSHSD